MRQTPTGRRGVAWLALIAILSAYVLAAGEARAQSNAPAVAYGTNGGTVTGGAITQRAPTDFERLIANRTVSGTIAGVDVTDRAAVRAGQVEFQALLKRPIASPAILRAGAVALKALPIVGTGAALWELYDQVRVNPDGSGGLKRDPGVPPVTTTVPGAACWSVNSDSCQPSPQAYCNLYVGFSDIAYVTLSGPTVSGGQEVYRCNLYRADNSDRGFLDIRNEGGGGSTSQSCPASIDFENPAYSIPAGQAPMADGKCRQARSYRLPITPEAAADILASTPSVQFDPAAVAGHAIDGGVDLAPYVDGPGVLTGPSSVPGPGTTTTTTPPATAENPNPAPVTTTTGNTVNITYNNNSWSTTITNITNNPDGSTTETTAPPDVKTCGLPGQPACKIDETGTPTAPVNDGTFWDATFAQLRDFAANPTAALPSLPSMSWSFQLPTGCAVIPLPAFAPFVPSIDVCQFQAMFHEIMTIVWLLGALFGAINMFFRNALAYN